MTSGEDLHYLFEIPEEAGQLAESIQDEYNKVADRIVKEFGDECRDKVTAPFFCRELAKIYTMLVKLQAQISELKEDVEN